MLGLALDVIEASDCPRGVLRRVADRVRTWPHRPDPEQLRAELLAAVLLHWAFLDGPGQERVLARPGRELDRSLRHAAETDAAAIASWIEQHPRGELAACAVELLFGSDRDASRSAARAMVGMVVRVLGVGSDPRFGDIAAAGGERAHPAEEASLAGIVGALGRAIERFEDHHQRDVLVAALLLGEGPESPGSTALGLTQRASNPDDPIQGGLRAVLRRSSAPFMRERAWRWLRVSPVRGAALDRLGRTSAPIEHELVLSAGHLVLHPGRQRALGELKAATKASSGGRERGTGGVLPGLEAAQALSSTARRWLPDVVDAVRPEPGVRSALRSIGLVDASAWVRHTHARRADPVEQADYVFDADPRVARSACLARSPAGVREWVRWPMRASDDQRVRLAGLLTRSPHASVRGVAERDSERLNPWLVGIAASRVAARQWLVGDREGFLVALRARIESGQVGQRVDAIRLARLVRVVPSIESLLTERVCVESEDRRVVATMVAALGDADSVAACGAIGRAMRAEDDRVRANAVEAGVRVTVRGAGEVSLAGVVFELKEDRHHRVRANALRGLIEQVTAKEPAGGGEAAGLDGLAGMLSDERDMHRLAGLWLAERALAGRGRECACDSWEWVCRRVAGMATRDEEAPVRARAVRCARRLLAEMRVLGAEQRGGVAVARAAA